MMNDATITLDLRRLLRTFYEEAELCETDGEHEQLITKVVKDIEKCRFCAFEKEQRTTTRLRDKQIARLAGNYDRAL